MNEEITIAILNHFETATGLPPVYYPNVSYDLPTDEHLIVDIIPAETITMGLATTHQNNGIVNVLIKTKENIGAVRANEISDLVLARFARNTSLVYGTTTVRIDRVGWISPPLGNIDGWYITPLTIPYNSIAK